MKNFTNFFTRMAVLSLALLLAAGAQATHFTPPSGNNGKGQWTLFIASAKVNGVALTAGDEVAIYDGSTCVGALVLTTDATEANKFTNQMVAYEVNGPGTLGYTPGNSFTFKCWDASASQEYTSTAYSWNLGPGDGLETDVFPETNTYKWSYPEVNFTQTSGTISLQGTVTENFGTHDAIAGAVVSINDGSNVTYQAITNSTGNYVFRDLGNDTYSATVAKSGYKTTTAVSIPISGTTVSHDFAMDKADGSIEGTVKDAAYAVINGATVTVTNAAGTTTYGTNNTNTSGEYSIAVPPGTNYSVTASKTGYQDYTYTGVSVTSGTPTYKHFVLTSTPGTITGTVTDGDGNEVGDVTVAVNGTNLTTTTSTDVNTKGEYTIHYVPVGTYTMTFTKTGYHDASVNGVTITATDHDVTRDATIYAKHFTFQSGDPFDDVWTIYLKTVTGDGAALKKDDEIAIYSPTDDNHSSGTITGTGFDPEHTGNISAFAQRTGTINSFSTPSGGGEVTVTCDAAHGLDVGDAIHITSSSGTTFNNATSFNIVNIVDDYTFTISSTLDASSETGTWTADKLITVSTTTDGLSNGDEVTISGTSSYDSTYTIRNVDQGNSFDIAVNTVATQAFTDATWVGDRTKVTSDNSLSSGDHITITGNDYYNGTYEVLDPTNGNNGYFYITKPYNTATNAPSGGSWYNTDTHHMKLVGVYYFDGPINNAGFANDLIAFKTLNDGSTGYTDGQHFVFKLWIAGGSQESDVHSISWAPTTANGLTDPGTTFPSGNVYSQATIDFDVPPGSIELNFTKSGTPTDSDIHYELRHNGTAVSGGTGTINTDATTTTATTTITGVDAGTYSLYAYGPRFQDTTYTNIQVYAGATAYEDFTIYYAPGETQTISLHHGYQLVSRRVGSTNIDPVTEESSIGGMHDFKLDVANFFRDEVGSQFNNVGGGWVNHLSNDNGWGITKGYIVYLDDASSVTEFTISGTPVLYNTPININSPNGSNASGYSIISYLPSYNLSASTAFASLKKPHLGYIRATDGATLRKIGNTWVDNIGTCSPGEGFLIKWTGTTDTTFTYPAQAKSSLAVKGRTNVHYTLSGGDPTADVFTMYVQGDVLQPGDEVAAYDGDKLVGIGVIESSDWQNNDLPIFSRINDAQGYVPGDPITLKVWKAGENKEYEADFTAINKADGDRSYTGDTYPEGDNKYEISDLKLSITGIGDKLAASISLYPNPSDAQVKITAPQQIESLQVLNLVGQKLFSVTPKAMQFNLDVSSYQPGVYFLNMMIDGQPVTKKLSVK